MSDQAKQQHNNILLAIAGFSAVVVIVALIGFLALGRDAEVIQGEMEVEEYRVSGKVPGRILELRVKEGDLVKAGDTLAIIEAPDVEAKMTQAQSAADAAAAMEQMAQNGARKEQVQAAFQLLEQANAALEIAEKSYNRMKYLYEEEVISAQRQARGAVQEVTSYIKETVQIAQMAGEVTDVYPKVGELVGTGTPIMSIAVMDDQWATFNIREDQLKDIKVGAELTVKIPALDVETVMKVTSMKDKGSFAVWKATKATGQYDQKTFEVKARPTSAVKDIRPGMSVILKK